MIPNTWSIVWHDAEGPHASARIFQGPSDTHEDMVRRACEHVHDAQIGPAILAFDSSVWAIRDDGSYRTVC